MRPPERIDGARVVEWAWSSPDPFFIMPYSDGSGGIPIHGLAICRYDESRQVYRFSCDDKWETQNDSSHDSIEDAKTAESGQYDVLSVKWVGWADESELVD